MYIVQPISKERIWGTSRLHAFGGDKNIEKIGSVFSLCANEDFSSVIQNGNDKGRSLYEVIQSNPQLFGLVKNENYPIIISITGADQDLSIQVHPTDEYAMKKEGTSTGKSESWYFLEQPENGWIYAQSKLSDKDKILRKMKEGEFEDVVDTVEVNDRNLVFIPSGTLHALTKGSLVYEVQQSTDITYRFYDYERIDKNGERRELHLEKAIETLKVDQKIDKQIFEPNKEYSQNPYNLTRETLSNPYMNSERIAQVITLIKGNVEINGYDVFQGMSLLVLPGETIYISGEAEVVIATPNLYWRDEQK